MAKKKLDEVLTFDMTRQRALELGLLICKCGHRPNNHFDHGKLPCAHCEDCDQYQEESITGTVLVRD